MDEVLFISDVGPTTEFTGGLVLRNIAMAISRNLKSDWIVLDDRSLGLYDLTSFDPQSKFFLINKPVEKWPRKKYLFRVNVLGEKLSEFDFHGIWQGIEKIIMSGRYSRIVVVLQGQTSFRIAEKLQQNKIQFSTLNWDPWVWWAQEKNVPQSFNQKVESVYKNLSTGRHMVPTMEFATRYKIPEENVVVLYPHVKQNFFNAEEKTSNRSMLEASREINLVFAGQLYAKEEFDFLLHSLDFLDWKVAGIPVRLHYFGTSQEINNHNVVNHGWIEPALLISELSKLDIGILPYPAFEDIPEVADLSFPSKFATYCAAGIPTIYIGPENTPVAKMIGEDSGWEKSDLDQEISSKIESCFRRKGELSLNVRKRYIKFFSEDAFLKSLAQAFELSELTPLDQVDFMVFRISKLSHSKTVNYSHLILKTLRSLRKFFKMIRIVLAKFKRITLRVIFLLRKIIQSALRLLIAFFFFIIMFCKSHLIHRF